MMWGGRGRLVLSTIAMVLSSFVGGFFLVRHSVPSVAPGLRVRAPEGAQLVMVFLGSSTCGASQYPGLDRAVQDLRRTLSVSAARQQRRFVSVGVALDQDPRQGMGFLKRFGPFDEVLSGGGWLNTGALVFIVREFPAPRALPQLVVIERDVDNVPLRKARASHVVADQPAMLRKALQHVP